MSEFFERVLALLLRKVEQVTIEHVSIFVLVAILWPGIVWLYKQARRFVEVLYSRSKALRAVGRVGLISDLREGDGPWALHPIHQPVNYRNNIAAAKILAVANYKGGVGKTTLTANIGQCLAMKHNLKVLLIDLDFQGSLSAMAFPNGDWEPKAKQSSPASRLISGDIAPSVVSQIAKTAWPPNDQSHKGCLDIITSHYDLANADTRLLVEWLLVPRQTRSKTWRERIGRHLMALNRPFDLRYVLAETLHAEVVLDTYDLILIDCPPRLTTGAIQALCASSHVMIPALMDPTSVDAVVRYVEQLESLKELNICPRLQPIGIYPTKYTGTNTQQAQVRRLADLHSRHQLMVNVVPESCFIPYRVQLLEAQEGGIAYGGLGNAAAVQALKSAIEDAAEHVSRQLGLAPAPSVSEQSVGETH